MSYCRRFKNLSTSSLFIISIIFLSQIGHAQTDTTRVLFVGNSFTFFHNLPQVVSAISASHGHNVYTQQSTASGANLEDHWLGNRNTRTLELIQSKQWDYVVFNNHSRSAIDRPDEFIEYGRKFANEVRTYGAEPVFMMTWAYKSNPMMQTEITNKYIELCNEVNADYVPCGPLFQSARTLRPDLNLFDDDKHPSFNGTYLLGLAFSKYFMGTSIKNTPKRLHTMDLYGEKTYLIFMDKLDATFLQDIVEGMDYKLSK